MTNQSHTEKDVAEIAAERPAEGCMSHIAYMAGAWVTLSLIQTYFGRSASVWFAIGFIAAAVIAMWEAGKAKPRNHLISTPNMPKGES